MIGLNRKVLSKNGNNKSFWHTLPGILTGIAAIVTAITGLIVGLSAAGILNISSPPQATPTPTPTITPSPTSTLLTPKPDLGVASVSIYPSQPQAGKYFYADVYVANFGEKASGSYDVAINIKDISRGSTYPIGTFRQQPMQPGEQYVVWSSNQVMVNDDGPHELSVEIIPFLFDDRNDSNNTYSKEFTVTP